MSGGSAGQGGRVLLLLICLLSRSGAQEANPIRAVVFTGRTAVSEADLRQAVGDLTRRTYSPVLAAEATDAIEKLYAGRGYTLARVRDIELLPDGTLQINLLEGEIERLTIIGNRHTRSGFLLDVIHLRSGMVFNENTAQQDRARLADLDIFESIRLEPVPSQESGKVDLRAIVKERRTGYLTGAAAYGDHVGVVGYLDAGEENFLGRAQALRFQWQRGVVVDDSVYDERAERRSAYQVTYENPVVLPGRLSFGMDLYHRETLFAPIFTALDVSPRLFMIREGGAVRAGTAMGNDTHVFLHYRRDRVHFDDVPPGLITFTERAGARGTVAALALSGVLSHRDREINPHRGYYGEARAELGARALGGSFAYTKFLVDARRYVPQGRATLLLRGMIGTGSRRTPLSEQFWMGGYRLMRGYDFDQFHGNRMAYLAAEYRWPVMPSIQAAIFAEEGFAWRGDQAAKLSDMRFSGGGGLRFLSPIGSIQLDVAMGNRRIHTYLTLGQGF